MDHRHEGENRRNPDPVASRDHGQLGATEDGPDEEIDVPAPQRPYPGEGRGGVVDLGFLAPKFGSLGKDNELAPIHGHEILVPPGSHPLVGLGEIF